MSKVAMRKAMNEGLFAVFVGGIEYIRSNERSPFSTSKKCERRLLAKSFGRNRAQTTRRLLINTKSQRHLSYKNINSKILLRIQINTVRRSLLIILALALMYVLFVTSLEERMQVR